MEREIVAWPSDEVKRRSGPGIGAYLRPWATTLGLIPAGWAAHLAWGDAGLTTGLAAAGITAAGACVTWLSWRLCRARTWYAALVAPATAGGITAWLATATIAGPGRPWLDLLIVGGGALSGLVNVHTWQRGQSGGRSGSVWDRPMPTWRRRSASCWGCVTCACASCPVRTRRSALRSSFPPGRLLTLSRGGALSWRPPTMSRPVRCG